MKLHNVRHFLAVCETGSINRAAEYCNVSQPSITRSIKSLEQEFGGSLFERNAEGCTLTALGEDVKPQFDALATTLESVKDVVQRRKDQRDDILRFGFACTLGPIPLQSLIKELTSMSNSGSPRLFDGPSQKIAERVQSGDLDAGLTVEPSYGSHLEVIDLYKERYVVSFYKGHRFEEMSVVDYQQLKQEQYILRLNCELGGRVNDYFPNSHGFKMNIAYESSQEQWVQQIVAAGHGVTIHPDTITVTDGILQRPLHNPELKRTVSLIMRKERSETVSMRRLTRSVQRYFG